MTREQPSGVVKSILKGPKAFDSPSAKAQAFLLYWRTWAACTVTLIGLLAMWYLPLSDGIDRVVSFAIGAATLALASEVWDP